MTKALLFGFAGFCIFSLVWVRRLTGPWVFDKAIGVSVYKYGVVLDPLFWTLALTVMFGVCFSLFDSGASAQSVATKRSWPEDSQKAEPGYGHITSASTILQ